MKALIIVDMLEDFVDGALANPRAQAIVGPLQRLLGHARREGWIVVFSNDAHQPGDPELKIWGEHAMAGDPGARVIAALEPHPGDREFVSPKRVYGAFDGTDLDERLRALGVDEVVLTGQHTHICVRHSRRMTIARAPSTVSRTAGDRVPSGASISVMSQDCTAPILVEVRQDNADVNEAFVLRERVRTARVARLATIDPDGHPHLVPIVFVLDGQRLYSAVDAKPKRSPRLRRVENARERPDVTILVDHYEDDWGRLWWVRLRGRARVLDTGDEAERALPLLADKYEQYRGERPGRPVLAVDVLEWRGWDASALA